MLIRFRGYQGKEVWINPAYVTSLTLEYDPTSETQRFYTAVHVNGMNSPYILEEAIEKVVSAISTIRYEPEGK